MMCIMEDTWKIHEWKIQTSVILFDNKPLSSCLIIVAKSIYYDMMSPDSSSPYSSPYRMLLSTSPNRSRLIKKDGVLIALDKDWRSQRMQ